MISIRAIRLLRALSRRIFGVASPHWIRDSLPLVRHANLFLAIPTLNALVFAPSHLFKSVPSILNNKKPYYATPLQFVSHTILLQLLVGSYVFDAPLGEDQLVLTAINLSLAFFAPFLAIGALSVLLVAWIVVRDNKTWATLLDYCNFNPSALYIPLSPSTYKSLDVSRLVWSLLYCHLYFYTVGMALALAALFGFSGVIEFLIDSGLSKLLRHRLPLTIIFGTGCAVLIVVAYKLFARPYVFLLLHSAKMRTPKMNEFLAVEVGRNPHVATRTW